jgi:hypothetical protein
MFSTNTGLLKRKRSDIYTHPLCPQFHYHIPFVSVSVLATRKDKRSTSFCLKMQHKDVSLKARYFQHRRQTELTGGVRPLDWWIPGAT